MGFFSRVVAACQPGLGYHHRCISNFSDEVERGIRQSRFEEVDLTESLVEPRGYLLETRSPNFG